LVFSSNVFLFLFLPLFLAVYYLAPFRFRSAVILVGSYTFYGWWRVDFLALFAGVTLWCFIASHLVVRAQRRGDDRLAGWAMATGVAGALGALGYFKYFDFGVENLNAALGAAGLAPLSFAHVILPIGISFYVFQAISYVVDVWRRDAEPARTFWDFSAFIGLFPQLVAGPVLRYKDMADQFHQREHSLARFSEGSTRFMAGFCKKVLIADSVAPLVDAGFALHDPSMGDAWVAAAAYTIQLYYDFSGYSDMAIGLGLMMGFRFRENFDHPYSSRSITEFWRRWHISLSTWLRDYLYIPLGGNRGSTRRTYINLLLTMLLGGLWHGAAWTYVLWGAWHGAFLAAERRWTTKVDGRRQGPRLGIPLTLLVVVLGWVMFRAASPGDAMEIYAGMVGLNGLGLSEALDWQLRGWQLTTLAVGTALVFVAPLIPRVLPVGPGLVGSRWQWVFIPLFLVAITRLAAMSHSPFLYFQF
jgi:alginate O-acetyltransferase complex protein AlgI